MNIFCRMLTLCFIVILSINGLVDAKPVVRQHHNHNRQHHNHHCIAMEDLYQSGDIVLRHFVGKNMNWEKYPAVYLVPQLENNQKNKRKTNGQDTSCPDLQSSNSNENTVLHERSISPWSYRIDYDENRYPQKLAYAECLCAGCIDTNTGKEIFSVNSVLIYQTMIVLRRKLCPTNSKTFTYQIDYEKVPVGCTCALPKY